MNAADRGGRPRSPIAASVPGREVGDLLHQLGGEAAAEREERLQRHVLAERHEAASCGSAQTSSPVRRRAASPRRRSGLARRRRARGRRCRRRGRSRRRRTVSRSIAASSGSSSNRKGTADSGQTTSRAPRAAACSRELQVAADVVPGVLGHPLVLLADAALHEADREPARSRASGRRHRQRAASPRPAATSTTTAGERRAPPRRPRLDARRRRAARRRRRPGTTRRRRR